MDNKSSTYSEQEFILCENGPFAGLTIDNARIVNSTLIGRVVYIEGGRFEKPEREFVFGGISLRDEGFSWRGPRCVGDLNLWLYSAGRGLSSSTWILSPSLVRVFEVLPLPELSPCYQCGEWLPQNQLRDDAWYGIEFSSKLICRYCWTNDGGPDLWWVR